MNEVADVAATAIAEYEAACANEGKRRWAEMREAGMSVTGSGQPPFGYRITKAVVEDETEQEILRVIAEGMRRGMTDGVIAEGLNSAGFRTRHETPWKAHSVKRVRNAQGWGRAGRGRVRQRYPAVCGSRSKYDQGCRCGDCRAAAAAYMREYKKRGRSERG